MLPKSSSHLSAGTEGTLEEGTGFTGMVESTLALVRERDRNIPEEMIRMTVGRSSMAWSASKIGVCT